MEDTRLPEPQVLLRSASAWRGGWCGAACRRRSRRPTPSWGSPAWPSSSTRSGCSALGTGRSPTSNNTSRSPGQQPLLPPPSSSSPSCLLADLGLRVKQAPRFAGSLAPSLRCYWFLLATRPSLRFEKRICFQGQTRSELYSLYCFTEPFPPVKIRI